VSVTPPNKFITERAISEPFIFQRFSVPVISSVRFFFQSRGKPYEENIILYHAVASGVLSNRSNVAPQI
jgi:hypothetical protein